MMYMKYVYYKWIEYNLIYKNITEWDMRKCTRKCKIEGRKKNWRKQWKIKYSVYIYKHDTCMCYINEQYIYMFYKRLYTMYTHGEFYIEIISTNSTLKKSRGGK